MKVLNTNEIKKLPVSARVLWGLALVLALVGMVLIILDCTNMIEIKTWVEVFPCTLSIMLNNFCLIKYKDKLYK